ncbi:putative ATP-grasp-modified RiPP [Streptomyces sp. NRRL S-241]|uniref:putative ATP-grasp-modified RiPP n=1 Tax=Streptomyces sp. NRRL S-241 TaxID=1463896 RepID=UPI0004C244EE|nr:putative ATP-grasp-modified RiPP [Streptomyces sp. NRRL S-241]
MTATAFALTYAQPREAEPAMPYTYDKNKQMNVCPDGTLAAENYPLLMGTAATSSTAGSRTHSDDD